MSILHCEDRQHAFTIIGTDDEPSNAKPNTDAEKLERVRRHLDDLESKMRTASFGVDAAIALFIEGMRKAMGEEQDD